MEKTENENENNKNEWYPGKYLGRKRKEIKEKEEKEKEEINLRKFQEDSEKQQNDDENKKETMICSTVRSIRMKYLERQLIGRIYLYRLSGVISTAMTSEVTSEDIMNYLLKKVEENGRESLLENDPLMQAEITGQYKRALSTVDTILNSLERRSLAYVTADFSHNTLLTRGTTIGISDPFFGLIGFSFTLELSATAHSLIASRRRFEIARDLALDIKKKEELDQRKFEEELNRSRSSSSSTSKFSFSSYFTRKLTNETQETQSTVESNEKSIEQQQEQEQEQQEKEQQEVDKESKKVINDNIESTDESTKENTN